MSTNTSTNTFSSTDATNSDNEIMNNTDENTFAVESIANGIAAAMNEIEGINDEVEVNEPYLAPGSREGMIESVEADFDLVLKPGSIKGAMSALKAPSRDLWQIDPTKLRIIDGFNPRVMNDDYRSHIRDIADSIKTEGFYQDQPLAGYVATVEGETVVYIYSGHSRLKAVLLAISEGVEIARVPVSVSQGGMSIDDMTVGLIRGNSGKELTFYESAIVCKRLIKSGFTEEEVSRRTGLSALSVANRMKLMSAPFKLRELVGNNSLSATLAMDMLAEHGSAVIEKVEEAQVRATETGKKKVRKAQTEASPYLKFVKKSAPKLYEVAEKIRLDPGYAGLSESVQELLNTLMGDIEKQATAKLMKDLEKDVFSSLELDLDSEEQDDSAHTEDDSEGENA